MRVLIVGCGYAGLPLGTERLRRSGSEALRTAGLRPLKADLTRLETLTDLPNEFDWVVNCAASGGGDADDYRQLYLEGNRNLLSWLADRPPRKFVYTSSTSVYAQNDGSLVTELSPAQPETPTARVLVAAEELLLTAARKRFPSVILRVAGIYGPGRGHAFQQFLRGEARLEGDGSRYLNMIHRDDLTGVIITALERGQPGGIYNAVDNEPVSQSAFFGWLAEELKRPLPPTVAVAAETWRKRGVTNKRVSNAKLRQEWGYQFIYPDFRSGYRALFATSSG